MQPLTVITGILLGTSAAIAAGLTVVLGGCETLDPYTQESKGL